MQAGTGFPLLLLLSPDAEKAAAGLPPPGGPESARQPAAPLPGPLPVNWVLINGETETGVTLHYMEEKPDKGDIVGAGAGRHHRRTRR